VIYYHQEVRQTTKQKINNMVAKERKKKK